MLWEFHSVLQWERSRLGQQLLLANLEGLPLDFRLWERHPLGQRLRSEGLGGLQ